ncbi:helix-hairpin-helix domain-containing protein [Solitalea sp. MAHUQ-68]|uniref:Helix-hairpin-helix domain-containing protein n=1 Tax=Solitalea agri TaxID=2953739 RepID=A0A9X2F8U7_9SPHI|nr:helix-hairpin-helix domain-containing protein [Solitalea agri]MCO4293868.1 helix-hairpin-helix domain-containing protein [Solitalea agri]
MKNIYNLWISFSKKEQNGLLVLAVISLIVIGLNFLKERIFREPPIDFTEFEREIAQFEKSKMQNSNNHVFKKINSNELKSAEIELKLFNPNNLQLNEWLSMGLTEKQARVIINYVHKGGEFRKKEDLKKIYSITEKDYTRLEPYIVIDNHSKSSSNSYKVDGPPKSSILITKPIELNAADSTELITLKGIGPTFANRILKYRNRLGGFHSKEQLKEVYGLDSVLFLAIIDKVFVNSALIQKVNINNASFNDLKRYPYWSYKQINTVLNYRKQHGKFLKSEDLLQAVVLDKAVLTKLTPYLLFE